MVMKTPAFKVVVNGRDITAILRPLLIELATTDDAQDDSDALELVLMRDPKLTIPERGALVELSLGWVNEGVKQVGRYVVDERAIDESAKTVILRCKATPFNVNTQYKQMQSHKTQVWQASTLGAVLKSIAQRNRLNDSISPELATIALTRFYQRQESDLHLVQRLAKQYHASFKINGGTLIFQAFNSSQTVKGQALPVHRYHLKDLDDVRYSDGGRGEGGSCVARYRLKNQKKAVEVSVGSGEPVRRLKGVYSSVVQAQQAALAYLQRTQKRGAGV
jgi:phage protein D